MAPEKPRSGSRPSSPSSASPSSHVRIPDLTRERSYHWESFHVDLRTQYVFSRQDGHSEWMRIRVPPELHDVVSRYVGRKSPFGYDSFSAAVRDALAHHFGALIQAYGTDEEQAQFGKLLARMDLDNRVGWAERQEAWVVSICERIDHVVTGHTFRNRLEDCLDRLHGWEDEVRELPDYGDVYTTTVMEHIAKKVDEIGRKLNNL